MAVASLCLSDTDNRLLIRFVSWSPVGCLACLNCAIICSLPQPCYRPHREARQRLSRPPQRGTLLTSIHSINLRSIECLLVIVSWRPESICCCNSANTSERSFEESSTKEDAKLLTGPPQATVAAAVREHIITTKVASKEVTTTDESSDEPFTLLLPGYVYSCVLDRNRPYDALRAGHCIPPVHHTEEGHR